MVGCQVKGGCNDFLGLTSALQRDRSLGAASEIVHVPSFRYICQEGSWENCINSHRRPIGICERLCHGIETGLGCSVCDDVLARSDGASARDIDNDTAASIHHALADQCGQAENSLRFTSKTLS